MPDGREQTISEIERILAEVKKPRKPRVEPLPEVVEPEVEEGLKPIPGLWRRLEEGRAVLVTPEIAKGMGMEVDIDPDWLLKFSPPKNGEQPAFNYISPEGVEFQPEEIKTREGKWLSSAELEEIRSGQYQAYDPETGEFGAVTRAVVEAREAAGLTPQELREISSGQFLVKDLETGEFVPTTEAGVVRREEYYRVKARQDELTSLFKGVFPELLAPYTEEQAVGVTQAFMGQMIETPELQEQFFETVQTQGRTAETERLLQMLIPGLTGEDLTEFFGIEAPVDILGQKITLKRPDWSTLDFWLENFFRPYGGADLKGKAAASFIAGIGDVISTTGGAARWLGYEDIGAGLSAVGAPLQRLAPPTESFEFEVADLANPEFYATVALKGIRATPFALSLAPLSIGGYYGGAGLAVAVGVPRIGSWIIGGLAGAALSRPAESAFEAGGQYDDAIARGKSDKEAREEADQVFRDNMVLAGADAWEIAIALAPTPKWVPTALVKGGLVRIARVGGKMVIVGLSQGGEELYQDWRTRHARGEEWQLDPISKEVFAIGAVMGMGMGLGGDVISSIVSKSENKMSPELSKRYEGLVSQMREQGYPDEQAKLRALDSLAEIPEGEQIIAESILEVKESEVRAIEPVKVKPVVPEAVTPVTPEVTLAMKEQIREVTGWPRARVEKLTPAEAYEILDIPFPKPSIPKAEVTPEALAPEVTAPTPIAPVTAVTPPEVPVAEPGMPEAGYQPAMIEGVPEKVVRPPGKGRIVQISMEEQLKLEQARRAVEEAPVEERAAYEAQAELEGLKEWQATESASKLLNLIKKTGWYKGEVSNLTLKQYRDITGKREILPNILTADKKHVRWEYALDEVATEMGYADGDALKAAIEKVGETNIRIKELEADIRATMIERPLKSIPEPTPAEIAISPTGEKVLTTAQRERTLGLFSKYVMSGSVVDAFELTRELRRETRAGQAENLKARAQELIIEKGMPTEQAMKQAIQETLSGELPTVTTDYLDDLTNQMRDVLFREVAVKMKDYPFEMASTYTALLNSLPLKDAQGNLIRHAKAIPREKGKGSILFPEGGSAWDRLNYVFGEQPQVLEALDTLAKEGKTLEDVIEGIFHETGRDPIPVDQATADYLRGLSSDILYEPTAFRDPIPVTRFEVPIDAAFKQKPLTGMTFMEQKMFVKVLKDIGWMAVDIGNLFRAMKVTIDNSFLRQGKALAGGHPLVGFKGHNVSWRAMFNQSVAEATWERVIRRSWFPMYDQIREDTGIDPLRVPAFADTKGTGQYRYSEEFGFAAQQAERWIPRLTAKSPLIKPFERAFSAGTNEIVAGILDIKYKEMLRRAEKIASGEITLKEGESYDIVQEFTEHMEFVANMIQRATLPVNVRGLAPVFNAFFFALRSKLARFFVPIHLTGLRYSKARGVTFNPRIMKEAWRDFLLTNSEIAGIMFLGSWLGLWDLEDDPRNAEFMSGRIGKTRIDPWAGQRQFVVLYARLVTRTGISSVTGAEYELREGGKETVQNFIENSLSPMASILLEFWTGRNFLGQVIDFANPKYWIEKIVALSLWDIWEAFEGEGWGRAAQVAIPAIYGEGVQTYTGDWEENANKLGLPKYMENTGYGINEPKYTIEDYYSDTASQFKGVDPETLTVKKGFDPKIKTMVEAKQVLDQIVDIPNRKLITVNADPAKGDTFVQYRDQWNDREGLVTAGDKAVWTSSELQTDGTYKDIEYKGEDALRAYDKKFPQAEQGNMNQTDYVALIEYWSLPKEEQKQYLIDNPGINTNLRQDWYRKHPKENALVAMHGKADFLTMEAYTEGIRLLKELDYPKSSWPDNMPPENLAQTHFAYEKMVGEGTESSVEAKLLLLKDQLIAEEAGVQSYAKWHKLKVSDESVEYLQMRVDNSELYDKLDEIRDNEKLDDIAKKEAVAKLRETKVGNETFHDIERRVDAMGKGTRDAPIPEETVNAYVKHMQIVDETSGLSAEARLNRYDNPDLNEYLMNEDYHGKQKAEPLDASKEYLDNYLVPRWRIDVEYRDKDTEYNAIDPDEKNPETGVLLRTEFLQQPENEQYRKDSLRRDALELKNSKTGYRLPSTMVEEYVTYSEYGVKGKRQERMLLEGYDPVTKTYSPFAIALGPDGSGKLADLPVPGDVPAVQFDDIYDQYPEQFDRIDGAGKPEAFYFVKNPIVIDPVTGEATLYTDPITGRTPREQAVYELRFSPDGKLTDFGSAEIRKKGYGFFVPETYIDRFVEFDSLQAEKGQVDYPDGMTWYGEDWYLFDHPRFYEDVYRGLFGLDEIGFVPHSKWRGLWEDWTELDFKYYGASDKTMPELYKADEDARAKYREQLLRTNPEYRQDRRKRAGLLLKLPDNVLDDYVGYNEIPFTDKAKSLDPFYKEHPNETYYEDDWYLIEHPEFYREMLALRDADGKPVWDKKAKDKQLSKAPTREVHALYKEYTDLITGKPREDFRWEHRDLDKWGQLVFGWKSITEKGRRAALTPQERLAEDVRAMEERLKR